MKIRNMGEGHVGSPTGSSQTPGPLKKTESNKKQTEENVENSACTESYKYISTMSSFEDPYFKETVRKELLKDKKLSLKALSELSPASV